MDTFALKLFLTPVLIGSASYAGRRWGEGIGGWLVGLPLTSAPVAFFLALDQAPAFVAAYAHGSLLGVIAETIFCLGYGGIAGRAPWPVGFALGTAVFAGATLALADVGLGLVPVFLAANAVLALALALLPKGTDGMAQRPPSPWDIPLRMIVATLLVVGLTAVAPSLGPRLAGIIASFPVFASTLTVFAHREQGAAAAQCVLRGLVFGLFGFTGFFLTLGFLIEPAGVAPAFAAAIVVNLCVQGASLWAVRRTRARAAGSSRLFRSDRI
ncbi:MAG: hypothetical protein HYR63_00440 [Proteobacteria bacterium]|nr:hypothetical protein [Pseudomonadota bacterium]